MFFLFFFIPYANNIGVFFNSAHQLTKHMLMSILKTFVMTAIVNVTKKKKNLLEKKVERDIENFIGVFLTTTDIDPDFEIFNAEPQNEQL
jgi:hypothetical protein